MLRSTGGCSIAVASEAWASAWLTPKPQNPFYLNFQSIINMLFFLICLSSTWAQCGLRFLSENQENWQEVSQGYLLGLYQDQGDYAPQNCTDCKNFGRNMAKLNAGTVLVEKYRDLWIDKDNVTAQDVFVIGQTLLETYNVFIKMLDPLDNMLQDKKLMQIFH